MCCPLSPSDALPQPGGSVIPPVTFVFCKAAYDSNKQQLKRADMAAVHAELSTLMCSITRQIQGSYSVSEQGGELAYMMAFNSPEVGGQLLGSFQAATASYPPPCCC